MPYKDPAKRAEIKRRWHERNPGWRAQWKRDNPDYWLKEYGLTRAQYDALAASQNGKCSICGEQPTRLVVDHCHASGKVRSLLCNSCNSAIGFVREKPEVARAVAAYLERHPSDQLKIVV